MSAPRSVPAAFLRRHVRSLGAVAAAAALTATGGCASAVHQQAAGAGGAVSAPTRGGILNVGTSTDIQPAMLFAGVGGGLYGNVFETLVTYPSNSITPQPSLATSWKLSSDRLSLTLQLRKGVSFSSGKPFNSKAVEADLKTAAEPASADQLQRTAAAITGYDTSSEDAITLKFAHPLGNIFDLLANTPIFDPSTLNQMRQGKAFVGTGPFTFVSWTPGSEIQLKANPHYWGTKPRLAGVDIHIIPDPTSLVSELRSGQVDLISGASYRDIQTLSKDSHYTTFVSSGNVDGIYVGSNVHNPALSDLRVRQAIAFAIDRNRIATDVYRGYGTAGDLPWPSDSPAYDSAANQQYAYNPAKATALVKQVQADKGTLPTIPLAYPTGVGDYAAVAQIVQSNLQAVGLKVQLQPMQYAQVVSTLTKPGGFDGLWLMLNIYANLTPGSLSVSAFPFNSVTNTSGYVDSGYQKTAERAWEQTPAAAKTAGTYDKLNQQLLKGLWVDELLTVTNPEVATANVHNVGLTKGFVASYGKTYLTN